MMKKVILSLFVATFICFGTSALANHHEHDETEKKEMNADADGDGKVSFEEFKALRMKHMEEHFKRRDVNNDGFIDADEKKSAREKRKSHHHKSCKRHKDEMK